MVGLRPCTHGNVSLRFCVVYGALLGAPSLLKKFSALVGEISVVNSEISPRRVALLTNKRKQILAKNLTETRDLGKEG